MQIELRSGKIRLVGELFTPPSLAERHPALILFIHGLSDETIPVDHAYQLYARAGEPKDLSLLEGATHRLRQDPRTIPKAIEWLKEVNRRQQNP